MLQQFCRVLIASVGLISPVLAQEDSLTTATPYKLSIQEDILNLKVQTAEVHQVYAASRNKEELSKTNVSTYIITANEIKQSGALTLGEALRLAPSLLVKQATNGYYHVSFRGSAGGAMQQSGSGFENTSLLLTINGIPFNNAYQGGIFWETVPVELNDILQIEIVAAPSTAFFGPNASSGVINLVTEEVEETVLRPKVSLQGGLNGNYAHRGSVSFGLSNRLKFRVSGHYNRLARWQERFYLRNEQRYIPVDSLLYYQANAQESNVSAEKALHNNGVNATVVFRPNEKVNLEAIVSTKESYLQSVLQPLGVIALTNRDTETSSRVAIRAQTGRFKTSLAYSTAKQNLAVGYEGFDMRSNNLFASTEYGYQGKHYGLKVGGDVHFNAFRNERPESFRSQPAIAEAVYRERVLLGTTSMLTNGVFLDQQLNLLDNKWSLFGTVRADRFSATKQLYGSYRAGSSYQVGKIHMIRASASSGVGNTFATNYYWYNDTTDAYQTNPDLSPLRTRTYEIGYRVVPTSEISLGATYYRSRSSDFVAPNISLQGPRINSNEIIVLSGITLDAKWSIGKLETSAFLTTQHPTNGTSTSESIGQAVPNYFGGFTGNYRTFLNKLKIGASVYYYDSSIASGAKHDFVVGAKLIANCKITYNFWDEHTVFINARNMFNSQKVEFPYADQTGNLYMLGIDLAF
ncbi:MAG: TonB-dependent receptor plug domain-containing protein [Tunicatimonas sp.]